MQALWRKRVEKTMETKTVWGKHDDDDDDDDDDEMMIMMMMVMVVMMMMMMVVVVVACEFWCRSDTRISALRHFL